MIDFHRPSSRRDQLCPFSPQTRDQTQNGMAFGASLSERKRSSASHNKPHRMKSAATLNYGCKNFTPSDLSALHLMYFSFNRILPNHHSSDLSVETACASSTAPHHHPLSLSLLPSLPPSPPPLSLSLCDGHNYTHVLLTQVNRISKDIITNY